MMPRDTNVHGTIFGGVILSYIDQAGAIAARPFARDRVVTVAVHTVEFKEPVYIGDNVSFFAWVTRLGATSISVHIEVEAERFQPYGKVVPVTAADVVYVSVDRSGQKTTVVRPGEAR